MVLGESGPIFFCEGPRILTLDLGLGGGRVVRKLNLNHKLEVEAKIPIRQNNL